MLLDHLVRRQTGPGTNAESQRRPRLTFTEQKRGAEKNRNPASHLRLTEYVVAEGEQLFSAVAKLGLEGMVAKKADSFVCRWKNKRLVKNKDTAAHEQIKKRIETWR